MFSQGEVVSAVVLAVVVVLVLVVLDRVLQCLKHRILLHEDLQVNS